MAKIQHCAGFAFVSRMVPQTGTAIMTAKAENITGDFEEKALIDIDAAAGQHYRDAPEWKKKQHIFSKYQILFYPMAKLGETLFHLSTQAAGLMAKVDTDKGECPCESASNKSDVDTIFNV